MKPETTDFATRVALFNAEGAAFAASHIWDDDDRAWLEYLPSDEIARLAESFRELRRLTGTEDGIHPAFAAS